MSAAATKPIIFIFLGIFIGLLLGIVITVAWQSDDTSESYAAYRERTQGASRRPQQSGDPHARDPHASDPHAKGSGGHGSADRAQQSFAKIHFMKKFVRALSKLPENMAPNPEYAPLIKEGAEPLVCADCHDATQLNFEAIVKQDPGYEAVEPYRRQPRFMIPLMTEWVKRLNQRHKDRLTKKVTCTDCHAFDPRDMGERIRIYPPLMTSFVKALKEKPTNKNPAAGWKPLLKDPSTSSMLCATCHGRTGEQLENALAQGQFDLTRPADFADNKKFMVHLMERWVERLNREAKDQLVKAVVCLDCHDTDPRR